MPLKDRNPLPPDFPRVKGKVQLTKVWSMELPEEFLKRVEDGALVLWNKHFTIWLNAWGNDHNETVAQSAAGLEKDHNPEAYDRKRTKANGLTYMSYRLDESDQGEGGPSEPAFYAWVIGAAGQLQMAMYFDKKSDSKIAETILNSVRESK